MTKKPSSIAPQIGRAFTGPAWHGEAIAELLDHDMETMVRDIVEHDAYLGGQIAMLKKVIRAARAPASTSGATKL